MKLSLLVPALTLLAAPAFAHGRGESYHFDRPARATEHVRADRATPDRGARHHDAAPTSRNDQPAAQKEHAPDRVNTCKKGECTAESNQRDHSDEK